MTLAGGLSDATGPLLPKTLLVMMRVGLAILHCMLLFGSLSRLLAVRALVKQGSLIVRKLLVSGLLLAFIIIELAT